MKLVTGRGAEADISGLGYRLTPAKDIVIVRNGVEIGLLSLTTTPKHPSLLAGHVVDAVRLYESLHESQPPSSRGEPHGAGNH